MALVTLDTAKFLRDLDDARSCISRIYYAAYQAAASASLAHGDGTRFPNGWNNPSHEQLPDLVQNNGRLIPARTAHSRPHPCAYCGTFGKTLITVRAEP